MSTPQSSSELTTRDVLQQIDHRLSLIEMDVRESNAKIDALDSKFTDKTDALDSKSEERIDALDSKFTDKIDALDSKSEERIDALDSKFTDKIDALDSKSEERIDALDSKFTDKIDALDSKSEERTGALDSKFTDKIEVEIRELRREFNGKFNLVIVLVITSWLSMMGTLLFKL